MAQYQVGRSVYELPDDLDQNTLNLTLQQLAEQEALVPKDSALGYSVDQAQRLGGRALQQVGTAFGSDTLAEVGQNIVEDQEQDMRQGGYATDIQDENVLKAIQNGRGFSHVGTLMAENGASTLATLGLGAAAGVAGIFALPVTAAVLGTTALVAGVGMGIGETADTAEQGGLDINNPNTARANLGIGAVVGLLDRIGAGKAIPKDQLVKMTMGEVADELIKQGKTGAAKKFLKESAKGFAVEGTTEAAQSAVMTAGVAAQGGELSADQVINDMVDSFAVGGATGAGVRGGISGVASAADKLKGSGKIDVRDPQAAADLAQRLEGIAEANEFDLNDIDKMSTTGSRATVDMAHVQLTEEMKALFQRVKEKLKITDADDLQTLQDKILAVAAQREGRSKTKSLVGQQEMDAVDRLIGDYQEGADAAAILRQLNELTTVHNSGYQGGIGQYTDQLSPFGSKVGYDKSQIATEALLRPLASGGLALQTGGASIAGQVAAVGAGRAIDGMTGRRSRVRRYVEQNANQQGQEQASLPSIALQRAAEAQQAEQEEAAAKANTAQANEQLSAAGAPPALNSPQFIMQEATGLPIDDILAALPSVVEQFPALADAARDFEISVRQGIESVSDLTPLIRGLKAVTGRDADAARLNMTPLEKAQSAQGLSQMTEGYNRGIESNRQFVTELFDAVNADKTIAPADKAIILAALNDMGKNLGENPVEAVQAKMKDILGRASDAEAVQKYLMPYVERVMGQQNAKKKIADFADDIESETKDFNKTSKPFLGDPDAPALEQVSDVFGIGDLMGVTSLDIRPTPAELIAMAEGTYKPPKRRNKEVAAQMLQDRWEKATGRTEPFEMTPENIDLIASIMATEAYKNIQEDGNAIGWYDRKLTAAKAVVAIIDPRVLESEANSAAFDFALAVTSNGAAVVANFENALEVFRDYMDNGRMPSDTFKKGGKRTDAMRKSFEFFNAYEASAKNLPIKDFFDTDFTVGELKQWVADFNAAYGTELSVPSGEGVNVAVKGSYILGAKIGQGFYQNLRGNFDPLTMDLWWMRMWNRMIGSPYQNEKDLDANRLRVAEAMKGAKGLEKQLIDQTLKERGETRTLLKNDQDRFDGFIAALDKNYQKYYVQYQKENKSNPVKSELFLASGTAAMNLKPQLQADPRNTSERKYMREVVLKAREKLAAAGFDINTADFQALMWYPEKQLFRHLGVAPGRGADNDYQDAAELLAKKEGISDDQIQEALAAAGADGAVAGGTNPLGQNGSSNPQSGTVGTSQASQGRPEDTVNFNSRDQGQLFLEDEIDNSRAAIGEPDLPIRTPTPTEVKDQLPRVQAMFEIGKKGGALEKGLNFEDAKDVGRALGYLIIDAKNKTEMGKVVGQKLKGNEFVSGVNIEQANMGAPKMIAVMKDGYVNPKDPEDQSMSSIDYLHTMLHEAVGHSLEKRPMSIRYTPKLNMDGSRVDPRTNREYMDLTYEKDSLTQTFSNVEAQNNKVFSEDQMFNGNRPEIYSPVRGGTEQGRADTVRNQFAEAIKAGETKAFNAQKAADDLIEYQKSVATSGRNPELGGLNVRQEYVFAEQMREKGMDAARIDSFLKNAQRRNFHQMAELLADGIAGYSINPDVFKKNFPDAAKMIRYYFNSPKNPTSKTVQFYAHPLPTVLAVMLAMMASAATDGGEEEQPPQGALSPQAGALTF
jgi:hypothetical protein